MASSTVRQRVLLGVVAAVIVAGTGVAVAAAESGETPGLPERLTTSPAEEEAGKDSTEPATAQGDLPAAGVSAQDLETAAAKAAVAPEIVSEATTSVDASLDALYAPLPKGEEVDLPKAVGEFMAEEVSNTQLERQDLGWTIEGAATLDGLEVVEVDDPKNPSAMTIRTCVDTGDVIVRNSAGRDMTSGTVTRSRSLFDLALVEGGWKVQSRAFAKNPDC